MSTSTLAGFRVGDHAEVRWRVLSADIDSFAELSQDRNPLHMDDAAARGFGFPGRVAHGALTMAQISRLIGTKLPGPGALWLSQKFEFLLPVFVGDELRAKGEVSAVSPGTGTLTLKIVVEKCGDSAIVLSGEVRVKVMPKSASASVEKIGGRVVFITGSSRGLGRAVAERFANDGARIILHGSRQSDHLEKALSALRERGVDARAVFGDLSSPAEVDRMAAEVTAAYGGVDIFVHCATPPLVRAPIADQEWSGVELYLHVYARSCLSLVRQFLPGMREQKFGRVIGVMTSALVSAPPEGLGAYVIAKSALQGLLRSLAVEVAPFGITVNMVSPSLLVTDLTAGVGERARQLAAAQTPLRRLASLDEVAEAIVLLAAPQNSYLTGVNLPLTGGA